MLNIIRVIITLERKCLFMDNNIPESYRPISAWGYFGYNILFAIPIIGFIMLLVYAFGGTSNINLRNYARSFFCSILFAIIITVIGTVIITALGITVGS